MERTVEIATGESISFRYELAGLGSRFLAVFVDLVIQSAVVAAAFFLIVWLAAASVGSFLTRMLPAKLLGSITLSALIVGLFLVFFGYFIVFEWRWQGRTPGKRLVGIRVVRDGGFPLDFTSSVIRNLVRILEFGAGFYLVSAISTLLSAQNRRLGDFAAGTIVVRDSRYERFAAPHSGGGAAAGDPVVRELSPAERDLIRRYVERRAAIVPDARAGVASSIAAPLRAKLGASFDHLDDDALLQHVASFLD